VSLFINSANNNLGGQEFIRTLWSKHVFYFIRHWARKIFKSAKKVLGESQLLHLSLSTYTCSGASIFLPFLGIVLALHNTCTNAETQRSAHVIKLPTNHSPPLSLSRFSSWLTKTGIRANFSLKAFIFNVCVGQNESRYFCPSLSIEISETNLRSRHFCYFIIYVCYVCLQNCTKDTENILFYNNFLPCMPTKLYERYRKDIYSLVPTHSVHDNLFL
jgi:hypothetical protein